MSVIKDQAMNRRLYDGCKTEDDLRVTTGPGRYQMDAPNKYCDACYVTEPTTRQQKWGASLNSQYIKTDVESDLLNINRPGSRIACNQYEPKKNAINQSATVAPKECSFPQTFTRLVDPPCTGRSSGWNRWEWLCDNPQENVMIPFDNQVTTRLQQKDQFRPCIPKPATQETGLPGPIPITYTQGAPYDEKSNLQSIVSGVQQALQQFPRGEDHIPAAPSNLSGGIAGNAVNPPSVAFAPYRAF